MRSSATSDGRRADGVEDLLAFDLGDAGSRLVEQEDFRPRRNGKRNFEQAPSAIGQGAHALGRAIGEAEAIEQRDRLGDEVASRADWPPPIGARALAFGDRDEERLQRREIGKKLTDLKGAGDSGDCPPPRRPTRHILAVKQDRPGGGARHAGELVHECRLSRAVRADQRMAGTGGKAKVDIVGRNDAAESFAELPRLENEAHRRGSGLLAPQPSGMPARNNPIRPPRTNKTKSTSARPSQNSQYCKVMLPMNSCSTRNTTAPMRPP